MLSLNFVILLFCSYLFSCGDVGFPLVICYDTETFSVLYSDVMYSGLLTVSGTLLYCNSTLMQPLFCNDIICFPMFYGVLWLCSP